MADWVSQSAFGTKFVCKLMAASRSSVALREVKHASVGSRHNVSINEQKIYHE